jgi:hypothetical protein
MQLQRLTYNLAAIAAIFLFLAVGNACAENVTDYNYWIGPTVSANPSPHLIDETGYNMTLSALWGDDVRNSTLDNFSGEGIIGGLTWPYNSIPGIFLMFIGFTLGIIMYIKLDGDLLIPSGILIITGILGAGSNLALNVHWEMITFCVAVIVLGFAGILYQLVVARDT